MSNLYISKHHHYQARFALLLWLLLPFGVVAQPILQSPAVTIDDPAAEFRIQQSRGGGSYSAYQVDLNALDSLLSLDTGAVSLTLQLGQDYSWTLDLAPTDQGSAQPSSVYQGSIRNITDSDVLLYASSRILYFRVNYSLTTQDL